MSIDTRVEIGLEGIDRGHHNITYRGVNCIKCPMDYVLYQMIIGAVRPDLIIEIGTNEGGSALYMSDLLQLYGFGTIHTIDIDDRVHPLVKQQQNIQRFSGGWAAYDLDRARKYKKVLVIEDSSHAYANTLDAITYFAPVVSPESYLIVEDGIVDALGRSEEFGGGPVKAIREFLETHPQFRPDLAWSDFFGKNATFNTIGYLKRITES